MTEDAQLKLRISQELREFIETEAKANYRTINGEVVYRLEQSRLKSNQTDTTTLSDEIANKVVERLKHDK